MDRNDVLCAISDSRLITWFYPNAVEVDKEIMEMTKQTKESQDIGPKIIHISITFLPNVPIFCDIWT